VFKCVTCKEHLQSSQIGIQCPECRKKELTAYKKAIENRYCVDCSKDAKYCEADPKTVHRWVDKKPEPTKKLGTTKGGYKPTPQDLKPPNSVPPPEPTDNLEKCPMCQGSGQILSGIGETLQDCPECELKPTDIDSQPLVDFLTDSRNDWQDIAMEFQKKNTELATDIANLKSALRYVALYYTKDSGSLAYMEIILKRWGL